MNRRLTALLGASAIGALAFAAPGLADSTHKNHLAAPTSQPAQSCEDGDTVAFAGSDLLWPPNHKAAPFSVTADGAGEDGTQANTDDAAEDVALEIAGTSDEVVDGEEMNGSGKPDGGDDVRPGAAGPSPDKATVNSSADAERSGRGDGRVYTIDWTATFDDGSKICSTQIPAEEDQDPTKTYVEGEPFTISVPHDMGKGSGKP